MATRLDQKIVREYKSNIAAYEKLDSIVTDLINQMIQEKDFFVMTVNHRVKSPDSLKNKLAKKRGKYNTVNDITDLVGIRVICYFTDTVDEIAKALEEQFDIDWENSIDKRKTLQATQFGYLSLHYICSLKESDGYESDVTSLRFEVQIRTVLQHAWAEIEHDLGYKSEYGVPTLIRREFSRVAGLLEVADQQFLGLRDSTSKYVQDVRSKITSGKAEDLLLDQVTLYEYVNNNIDFQRAVEYFEHELAVDMVASDLARFLPMLEWLGAKTIGDLNRLFRLNQNLVIALTKYNVEDMELDIISISMVFRNLCKAELMRKDYSSDQVYSFMEKFADDRRIEKNVEQFYELKWKYSK